VNPDVFQQLLDRAVPRGPVFPDNSRYQGVDTGTLDTPDGPVVYLLRRFVPQPETLPLVREYEVQEQDRLDNLASQFLGDPLLFWRLCDANRAMRPEELEQLHRRLRITLPQGMPGPANA
jgi:hypothetical protein